MSFQPFNPPPRPNSKAQTAVSVAAVCALAVTAVASFEGLRNDPYDDVRGIRTVCYGETAGVQERHYSTAECTAKLQKSLEKHAAEVLSCLPVQTPIETKAAFASFAYNVGAPKACASTAAKKIRAGDIRGGCDALLIWTMSGGKYAQGLANRRSAERSLCLRGLGSP